MKIFLDIRFFSPLNLHSKAELQIKFQKGNHLKCSFHIFKIFGTFGASNLVTHNCNGIIINSIQKHFVQDSPTWYKICKMSVTCDLSQNFQLQHILCSLHGCIYLAWITNRVMTFAEYNFVNNMYIMNHPKILGLKLSCILPLFVTMISVVFYQGNDETTQ